MRSDRTMTTTRKLSELPEASHPFSGTESIPLVQEGETRQVALANLLGESAIATWLAPYRVSSEADPSENRAAINQAILDAVEQTRPPVLLLPPGRIPLDGPIILRRGIRINGASSADLPIGTELFLADGVNGAVVQTEGWPTGERTWDCAELAYLRINGNRAGNPEGGPGIAIRHMGNSAEIRQVVVRNCNGFGMELSGIQEPASLRACTLEDNGAGGLKLAGEGLVVIHGLSARGAGPLVLVTGEGALSVVLTGAASSGHQPVVEIREGQPQVSLIAGRVTAPSSGGGSVVEIAKGRPGVHFVGLHHAGFERLVRDGNGEAGLDAIGGASGIAVYNTTVRAAGGTGRVLGLGVSGGENRREPVIIAGIGMPADDLALPNGSLYLRGDGGEGSTFYVREEGRWTAK
jgi:hypothetical protein